MVEVEVRVDDDRDPAHELVRQRVRPRLPVRDRRVRVDHPGVDEHEPIRVRDRVHEDRDDARPRSRRRRPAAAGYRHGRARGEHTEDPMATTTRERKLLVDGEWFETGAWIEVRSPYSGEVVGRVAKAGAAEARRALDAAGARPRRARCRRTSGRRSSTGSRALLRGAPRGDGPDDLRRGGQADPHRAGRGLARRLDLHVRRRRGAQARRRGDPDGRLRGGRWQARVHAAQADRRSSARSRPSTSRATSSRTSSPPRSRPAARSCSSRRARRRSPRSCSPSSSRRRACPPAG